MRKLDIAFPPPAPPNPESEIGTPVDFGYLLRQAAGAHRLRMDRALADLAVTPPQFLILTLLAAHPGRSSADLARISLLTTATVSVIVANLERMGAVFRRTHAMHGRIQHLDLSPDGERLLAACKAPASTVEAELAAGLDDVGAEAIRKWLIRAAGSG